MSDETPVLFDATRAGVGIITLNRPEKHNAFNPDVIEHLTTLMEELRGQDGIRVVFLKGAGKSFSAGADLDWMRHAGDWTHDENEKDASALAEMLFKLHSLPMPTVALVDGAAIAGGMGLVSACDMVVATKNAQFGLSEVHLGLTPATISPYVIEAVGPRWARALFSTGMRFDAEFAREIGLVQWVVEDEGELAAKQEELTKLIFKGAKGAIADALSLVDDVKWRELDKHMRNETAKRIADRRSSAEGKEGLNSYLEKRKPLWAE